MNKLGIAILIALFIPSCATYQTKIEEGVEYSRYNQHEPALEHFKALLDTSSERDRLAYLLEYASALQIAGRYQESTRYFNQADQLGEQLDYLSVSNLTMATLGGEEMVQYKGESFERILIHVLNALNYLAIQDLDSAMVEIRKIDLKVKKYQTEIRSNYEVNPLGTYLSGLLYDSQKQWDDAFIAYQKSQSLGMDQPYLNPDLARVAKKAQRMDQLDPEGRQLSKSLPFYHLPDCKNKECGEVIIIFLQGLGPQKLSYSSRSRIPVLSSTPNSVQKILCEFLPEEGSRINLNRSSELVYDVTQVAQQTLEADYSSLVMRRFGGDIAKYVVADKISEQNEALGTLAYLFMSIADRADLRQWRLLPHSVQMIRQQLPVGKWRLNISGQSDYQETIQQWPEELIQIKKNQTYFLIKRSIK